MPRSPTISPGDDPLGFMDDIHESKTMEMSSFELATVPESVDSSVLDQTKGLSSEEATKLFEEWGANEIPVHQKTVLHLFAEQFVGTMPFILEVCIIVSAVVQDWVDFGVIFFMLVINACLGMKEQLKARGELAKLTAGMVSTVSTKRDDRSKMIPVTELVPGDVILLVGGSLVPADVRWLKGDVLSIDTAALTGEPMPRKYPSPQHGDAILSGCTVKAGEAYCLVVETGSRTEIGSGFSDIANDRQAASVSVFEREVLNVVSIIIALAVVIAVVICLVQGIARNEFGPAPDSYKNPLLAALSILIASVPVALPLVLQVTMAVGAAKMATVHHAIVTRMSALQDIASMQVLCSDKTGTITTAKMSINLEKTEFNKDALESLQEAGLELGGLTNDRDAVIFLAALGSNPAKVDDAIDSAVMRAFQTASDKSENIKIALKSFSRKKLTGFSPEYKRTVATIQQQQQPSGKSKEIIIAKGLLNKVLNTHSGDTDDADKQWRCVECDMNPDFVKEISRKDEELASEGYKTIAVAASVGEDGPMHFVGLLPMIDPPRLDSKQTIQRLHEAGVEVKMITGDHQNIAKETARLVGLNQNIQLGEVVRSGTYTAHELVRQSGGFAQVLPRDKRECVLVLQNTYSLVVGMTGDGVNDAPALSAARCGIAVADATDAAKHAAAMILTEEGLGAVFGAVVESRKIAARLLAYVSYRLATTIQILTALTIIVLVFNCEINTFYIVLLALLNDLTMIPIAEDRQQASLAPHITTIGSLIGFSLFLGIFQAGFTIIFYTQMDWFLQGHLDRNNQSAFGTTLQSVPGSFCNTYAQSAIWLQISISAELLIMSARAPGLFFMSRPSTTLLVSTMIFGCVLCSLLAVYAFPAGRSDKSSNRGMRWDDVGVVWAYDLVCLVVLDLCKLVFKQLFELGTHGVIDEARYAREDAAAAITTGLPPGSDETPPAAVSIAVQDIDSQLGIKLRKSASMADDSHAGRVYDLLSTGRSMTQSMHSMDTTACHGHFSSVPNLDRENQQRNESQRALAPRQRTISTTTSSIN